MKPTLKYVLTRVLVGALISLLVGAVYEARAAGYIENGRPDVGLRGLKYKYGANSSTYREALATARIRSTAVGGTRYVSKALSLSNRSLAGMARAAGKVGLRMNLFTAAGLAGLQWYFGDPDGDGEPDFYPDEDVDGSPDTEPQTCNPYYRLDGSYGTVVGCSPDSVASQYNGRGNRFGRTKNTVCTPGSPGQCTYDQQADGSDYVQQRSDPFYTIHDDTFESDEPGAPQPLTTEEVARTISDNPETVQRLLDGALRDQSIADQYNETQEWLRDLRDNIARHENGDPNAPLLPEIADGANQNPFSPDNYTREYRDSLADIRDESRESNEYLRDIRDTNREIRDSLKDPSSEPGGDGNPDDQPSEESEHPTDCDLFQPGCEIRDWLVGDPPPDEPPEAEIDSETLGPNDWDVRDDYDGQGSCPADQTVDVMGQTITVPWTPICDFMVATRPGTIAGAWLIGLMIVGGAGKRKS